jgi:signal recognition particle receptor subunit beta
MTKFGNTSILIACNKQDFDLARAESLIKQTLEKEM